MCSSISLVALSELSQNTTTRPPQGTEDLLTWSATHHCVLSFRSVLSGKTVGITCALLIPEPVARARTSRCALHHTCDLVQRGATKVQERFGLVNWQT